MTVFTDFASEPFIKTQTVRLRPPNALEAVGSVPQVGAVVPHGVGGRAQTGEPALAGRADDRGGVAGRRVQAQLQPHGRIRAVRVLLRAAEANLGPLLGGAVAQRAQGVQHLWTEETQGGG